MQVTRDEKSFQPITIVLETMQEFLELHAVLNCGWVSDPLPEMRKLFNKLYDIDPQVDDGKEYKKMIEYIKLKVRAL
jgi:hypothetical protein